MSAYFIANVEIKDGEKLKEYMSLTPTIVRKYGGKFLVRVVKLKFVKGIGILSV